MRRTHRFLLIGLLAVALGSNALGPSTAAARDSSSPVLDLPRRAQGAGTIRVAGRDPIGSRSLVLWRWSDEEFRRIANTRSDAFGRFDFGVFPVPIDGLMLHVSVRGSRPSSEHLDRVESVFPAPRFAISGLEPANLQLTILPALLRGELRIFDESERLILRRSLESGDPTATVLRLDRDLPWPPPIAIHVLQVLPDGRRSKPAYWKLPEAREDTSR